MPDTYTPNLLLVNQTEGANNNSWGAIVDANWEEIDDKFGDVTSISTTGGNTTLSDSQEIVNAITVSGTLVSNATIIFSGRGGTWIVRNATTGNFSVTCKVSGQTGVEITQGSTQPVYCNGTDIQAAGASSAATSIPVGTVAPYIATTAPTGWVRANGRTIGNGSSGGTERANADTATLYALLWDNYSNSVLAIQDSAGTLTTRGVSATADYAANKRLPLPDLRGRAWFGLDDMGNSAASRLGSVISAATTNGSTGGTETVTLTEANLAAHTHSTPNHTHTFSGTTASTNTDHTHSVSITSGSTIDSHTHAFSATTGTESVGHTHTFSGTVSSESNDHTHTVSLTTGSDGAHTHTVSDQYVVPGSTGTTGNGSISQNHSTQTQTTSSNGSHTHSVSGSTSGRSDGHTHTYSGTTSSVSANHTHSVSGTTGASSSAGHTHTVTGNTGAVSTAATHTHTYSGTTASGGASTSGSAGSGTAHSNMPPAWLGTFIIKL